MKTRVCLKYIVNDCRIKRQIMLQRIRTKFHDIIGFGNISKITVNPTDNGFDYNGTPPQIFLLKISEILRIFPGWRLPKLSQQTNTCSTLALKSPILPQLMSF